MHGQGQYFWPDGCFYKGQWVSDSRSGQGIERLSDGSQYEGNFVDNVRNGFGTMLYLDGSKFEGNWQHEHWNGLGTFTSADGSALEGEFVNGVIHGHGTERDANGEFHFEGEWKNGVREGQGILKTPIGEYNGEFFAGKKQGHGTDIFASGSKYCGQFVENQRHGHGLISYSNGRTYDGHWKFGEYCGYGNYAELNGYRYSGEWENDLKHGQGCETIDKDTTYEGQFHKGLRHGKGKTTTLKTIQPTSQTGHCVHEGMYAHNKKSGVGSELYPDGSCFHGVWCDNMKHGPGLLKIANDATYHVIFHEDTIVDIFYSTEPEGQSTFPSFDSQGNMQHENKLSRSQPANADEHFRHAFENISVIDRQSSVFLPGHSKSVGSSSKTSHVRFDPFEDETTVHAAQASLSIALNSKTNQFISDGRSSKFSDFAAEDDRDIYEINEADVLIAEAAQILSTKNPQVPQKVTIVADFGIWGAPNSNDPHILAPSPTLQFRSADTDWEAASQSVTNPSFTSGTRQQSRRLQSNRHLSSAKQHRVAGSTSKESVASSGSKNTKRVDIFNL